MDILQGLFHYFAQNKYLVVFIGTIIGGETVLLAAGFLASLGHLDVFLVVLFGGGGEVVADTLWYWIGYLNNKKFIIKYGRYVFLNVRRVEQLKDYFAKHGGKTLLIAKLMYGVRTTTLLIAGMAKMNFFRFLLFNTLGIFILVVLFTSLGYLFGHSWVLLDRYTIYVGIFMTVFLLSIIILTIYIRRKAVRKLARFNELPGKRSFKYLDIGYVTCLLQLAGSLTSSSIILSCQECRPDPQSTNLRRGRIYPTRFHKILQNLFPFR